jgi:hypothetical protein
MDPFFIIYTICWISACLLAMLLYVRDRSSFSLSKSNYWQFIYKPWKIITFFVATTGMVLIAPYTGDPTWDYFDAFFMSALTYLTAPWSIGSLYLAVKRRKDLSQAFVAFCLWIFSASWSYDLYLLLKNGYYPVTWFSNIFASSVLYISAGLFWNLDWIPGRGVTFAFLEENWPQSASAATFSKIYWVALLFMIFISFLILYFFWFKVGT